MSTQINPINSSSSTPLNDSIEVLVHFHHGQLQPLRFLWKNRSFRVESVTTTYRTRDGDICYLHFAVQSASNLYQLSYNLDNHSWKLTHIDY